MTRLVSGVITAARDRHAAFDRQRMPDGMLYRFFADYCQEAQGRILNIDPTYSIEETLGYAMPLSDFDAGLALGAGRIVTEVTALDTRVDPPNIMPIDLISRDQRFHRNGPVAAAWQDSDVLYLRGPESMWTDIGSIEVQVLESFSDADVAALQVKDAVMPLPNAAALMVTEALAFFMARRLDGNATIPINVGSFERTLERTEAQFYKSVADRQVGRSFFTADVMNYDA